MDLIDGNARWIKPGLSMWSDFHRAWVVIVKTRGKNDRSADENLYLALYPGKQDSPFTKYMIDHPEDLSGVFHLYGMVPNRVMKIPGVSGASPISRKINGLSEEVVKENIYAANVNVETMARLSAMDLMKVATRAQSVSMLKHRDTTIVEHHGPVKKTRDGDIIIEAEDGLGVWAFGADGSLNFGGGQLDMEEGLTEQTLASENPLNHILPETIVSWPATQGKFPNFLKIINIGLVVGTIFEVVAEAQEIAKRLKNIND